MNLIGHVAIARSLPDEARSGPNGARFLLGSMLPDLAGMIGLRIERTEDLELSRGVAFHGETDDAFHACEEFTRLLRDARTALRSAGVARGATLATSHIGVELLLDGVLAADDALLRDVRRALRVDTLDDGSAVLWRDRGGRAPGEPPDWRAHRKRLDTDRFLRGYAEVGVVGDRLLRVLARRPRLAVTTREETVVRDWLLQAQEVVRKSAPRLLAQVHDALLERRHLR